MILIRPTAKIPAFKRLVVSQNGRHTEQLPSVVRAVRDQMEYLMQTPITFKNSQIIGCSSRQQPSRTRFLEQQANVLQASVFVVRQTCNPFNFRFDLQTPGSHHVGNMKHRVVQGSQSKTKIALEFLRREFLEELHGLVVAPQLKFDQLGNGLKVIVHALKAYPKIESRASKKKQSSVLW